MNQKTPEKLKKSIANKVKNAIPKHCSNCGSKYEDEDLVLIRTDEYGSIFHLVCKKCKEAYLINVVSPLGMVQGSNRVPVRVDISSADDAKNFIGADFVTSNDVLDMHDLLENTSDTDDLLSKIVKNK